MGECFYYGNRTVIWDSDFDFSDFCQEGEGIVHILHCTHCGAQIQYMIPTDTDDSEGIEGG